MKFATKNWIDTVNYDLKTAEAVIIFGSQACAMRINLPTFLSEEPEKLKVVKFTCFT